MLIYTNLQMFIHCVIIDTGRDFQEATKIAFVVKRGGIMKKPTLQKCYEKMQMIKNNPDQLVLMAAKENGKPCLVLALADDKTLQTGGQTPVAIILDQGRVDSLVPDYNASKAIAPIINGAEAKEHRTSPKEFDGQDEIIDQHFAQADF